MKLLLAFILCSVALAKQAPHLRDEKPHTPPGEMEPLQGCSPNGCKVPCWKGDNFCDDENNTAECEWDGGDCCDNDYGWWDYYCQVSVEYMMQVPLSFKELFRRLALVWIPLTTVETTAETPETTVVSFGSLTE